MIGNDSLDGRPWPVLCLDTDRTEVDCRARGTFDYLAAVGTGEGGHGGQGELAINLRTKQPCGKMIPEKQKVPEWFAGPGDFSHTCYKMGTDSL